MLILQRRKGQSLSINDNITLTVVDTGADWVKLAIDAPKEVPILRSELKEAAAENQKASATAPLKVLDEILKRKESFKIMPNNQLPRLWAPTLLLH